MYKEFNEIFSKARQGDGRAKEEIVTRLEPLIISSIKRYYYRKEELDDLIQDGYLTILQCIEDYDESKGVKFLGYVKLSLKFLYLDKHKARIHLSLNDPMGEDGDEWINQLESEEDSQIDIILKKEEAKEIIQAIFDLPRKQRQTIIAFYIERKTIPQIAKDQGITYRTVVNTKTNAIKKLRKLFEQ